MALLYEFLKLESKLERNKLSRASCWIRRLGVRLQKETPMERRQWKEQSKLGGHFGAYTLANSFATTFTYTFTDRFAN